MDIYFVIIFCRNESKQLSKTEPMFLIFTHYRVFGRMKLPDAKISPCCCIRNIPVIANSVFALDPE